MTVESVAHSEHSPNLAHHFDTPTQQFESGKLGMWLFCGTELLMFGGLFCAYTIFRATHPEVFHYGHQFLDKKLGAINTVVLICSSFTMANGVRAAQMGRRTLLAVMLSLTLLCAAGFLGIKYVEYSAKFQHGLLWGKRYHHVDGAEHESPGAAPGAAEKASPAGSAGTAAPATANASAASPGTASAASAPSAGAKASGTPPPGAAGADRSVLPSAAPAPEGLAAPAASSAPHEIPAPPNPQLFFGIYFAMTGLHGIHVLAGMVVITWLLVGTLRGRYGPDYFTPVDLVGLYWHIVDMIWIFLFPLFYLIG
ncbi:MAG: cytochrome c oxidase subunit 3 family protein [bacterium]